MPYLDGKKLPDAVFAKILSLAAKGIELNVTAIFNRYPAWIRQRSGGITRSFGNSCAPFASSHGPCPSMKCNRMEYNGVCRQSDFAKLFGNFKAEQNGPSLTAHRV